MNREEFEQLRDREFSRMAEEFVQREARSIRRIPTPSASTRGTVSHKRFWVFLERRALAFAAVAAVFFGAGVLFTQLSPTAAPLWQQVPPAYHPARVCTQGGYLADPVALTPAPVGGVWVADTYYDWVLHVPEGCSRPSLLIRKEELEHAIGFRLTGASDGPVGLAYKPSSPWKGLFIVVAALEHQGKGLVLHFSPDGDLRVLAELPLEARDARYGPTLYDDFLYIPGSDGGVYRLPLGGEPELWRRLSAPTAVALDPKGRVYVADEGRGTVQRFFPDGRPDPGFVLQGLENPTSLAFGPDGTLYVAESGAGGRIRRFLVDAKDGPRELSPFERFSRDQLTEVNAGAGEENGPLFKYGFQGPAIALDPQGTLWIADNTGAPFQGGKLPTVYKIVPKR